MVNAMADGGGGGSVEISIARIKEIATSTMAKMHDNARTDSTSFRNTKLGDGAFGHVPQALEFSAQQEAAHGVFLDTITAILAELEEFRTNLIVSADAHQTNDESVESTMAAMNERYGKSHTWSAQEKYDHERTDNKALDVKTERDSGAEGTTPADRHDDAASPPAPATTTEAAASGPSGYGDSQPTGPTPGSTTGSTTDQGPGHQ